MREKLFNKLAHIHAMHPWRMLVTVLFFTLLFMVFAGQLTVTPRWSDLLPSKDIRTLQFNKILEEFTTASSIVVVVQGEEEQIKSFADAIVPKIKAGIDTSRNMTLYKEIGKLEVKINFLKNKPNKKHEINELQQLINEKKAGINEKLIKRVDYKQEVDFLKNHGLMLIKEDDLKNLKDSFTDPNLVNLLTNLNNSMEKEYVGRKESISTRQKEDQAVVFMDGLKSFIGLLQKYSLENPVTDNEAQKVIDKLLIGDPYFQSYDKKALIINVIPNFSVMDIDRVMVGTQAVQSILDKELKNYPQVKAGLTGMVPLCHDEMVYSTQSLGYTSLIAFIAILIMLIFSFRMWSAPLLAALNLIVGIIWATGTAAIVVGQLNLMTYMFSVILIGLGIDFSIHIISGFTEFRSTGLDIQSALNNTFQKIGKGILTGGITTSIAFLTLIISSSRGMKEMGLVTGFGLFAILLATFLFLPSLLVLRDRRLEKKKIPASGPRLPRDISFRFLGQSCDWLGKHYIFTIVTSTILTILLVISASRITFDHNYMNIEPEGLTSITLQDTILTKFDLSMDYGLVLAGTLEESNQMAKKYRDAGSVAMVEDISTYLPSKTEQKNRLLHIQDVKDKMAFAPIAKNVKVGEISKLVSELERLEMNIIEIQDMAFLGGQDKVDTKCNEIVGDPDKSNTSSIIQDLLVSFASRAHAQKSIISQFQHQASPYFKESVLKMCNSDFISFDELPISILDRYCNRDRSNYLLTVFPSGNIWQNAEFLNNFASDLERTSPKATGMPPIFRALIEIIGKDGRNAALLTVVIIFLVLWFDFRHPGYALMAMIPLAAGVFWMVGLMHLFGLQLTVMNVMGIPLIIGIGIDDGVHIVHRWLSEGKGNLGIVFASTGKAILLTSLTTMLAFGSLVFSIWRGFGQLGSALFIGVGACFLATVFILPGILGLVKRDH